jgi:hypothetical protein
MNLLAGAFTGVQASAVGSQFMLPDDIDRFALEMRETQKLLGYSIGDL